jgi:hypothetical protein
LVRNRRSQKVAHRLDLQLITKTHETMKNSFHRQMKELFVKSFIPCAILALCQRKTICDTCMDNRAIDKIIIWDCGPIFRLDYLLDQVRNCPNNVLNLVANTKSRFSLVITIKQPSKTRERLCQWLR